MLTEQLNCKKTETLTQIRQSNYNYNQLHNNCQTKVNKQ